MERAGRRSLDDEEAVRPGAAGVIGDDELTDENSYLVLEQWGCGAEEALQPFLFLI